MEQLLMSATEQQLSLANHLIAIHETEKNVKEQLSETKNEMVDQLNALRESTESVLSQNETQLGEIESNLQIHFEKMKNESIAYTFKF